MFHWTVHVGGDAVQKFNDAGIATAAVEHKMYGFTQVAYCYYSVTQAYLFNTVSLRWRPLGTVASGTSPATPPHGGYSMRSDHTAVPIQRTVYVWGGYGPHSHKLCAFDVEAHRWSKPTVSGTVPGGRNGHSACGLGDVMFVYGGKSKRGKCDNDMYKLDTKTMVWSLINTKGTFSPASHGHSATIIGTKMFVFGGEGLRPEGFRPLRHIRVFDTETDLWLDKRSAQPFPGRMSSRSLSFDYNGEVYVTAASCSSHIEEEEEEEQEEEENTSFDLWKFNPKTFSWTEVKPKGNGPSCTHCALCRVSDRVAFLGESGATGYVRILDLRPDLKTLCKLAVLLHGLERSELPHNIWWGLAAMTNNRNGTVLKEV